MYPPTQASYIVPADRSLIRLGLPQAICQDLQVGRIPDLGQCMPLHCASQLFISYSNNRPQAVVWAAWLGRHHMGISDGQESYGQLGGWQMDG